MAIPDFLRSRLHLLITKFLKKDLAIDLGTSNTLIWIKGQGIVVNEPSVLAVRSSSKEGQTVIAVGHEAKSMLGREPQNIVVARPIKKGVIGDFTMTAQMVKSLIDTALPKGMFKPQPRIIISVPGDSTQVERRAIREAALSSGSTEVYLIEEPIAAALGAGLPIADAKGSMVLNMGGGTTELAVISLGGVVYKAGLRLGGDDFEESIINHIRREHGLLVGERSAERLKIEAGNALPNETPFSIEVSGQKFPEGVPRSVTLSSTEIYQALLEPLAQVSEMLKLALEQTPAELAADLAQSGIVMTGGGALLKNMDKLLMSQTGLPIRIADEPLNCVVKGCSIVLENMSKYQSILAEEE